MKKTCGKYYNIAAGIDASNIIPGHCGQRGVNIPPILTK